MRSYLVKGAAHLPIDWSGPQSTHAAITVGWWGGKRWAWEQFDGAWDVLHAPSLELLEQIMAEIKTGAVEVHGLTSAKQEIKAWPTRTRIGEDDKNKTVNRGVPRIAGGLVPLAMDDAAKTKIKAWKAAPEQAIEKIPSSENSARETSK